MLKKLLQGIFSFASSRSISVLLLAVNISPSFKIILLGLDSGKRKTKQTKIKQLIIKITILLYIGATQPQLWTPSRCRAFACFTTLFMVTHHGDYPTLTDSRTVAFSGFIVSYLPKSTTSSPDSIYSWPRETGKTKDWISERWEWWTLHSRVWSPIATSCQSLRAELVSATYFVHRRGYHDTKYYKTFCSCTKTNIFVEILHFKQQLIQSENCRLCARTDMDKDSDSIHFL